MQKHEQTTCPKHTTQQCPENVFWQLHRLVVSCFFNFNACRIQVTWRRSIGGEVIKTGANRMELSSSSRVIWNRHGSWYLCNYMIYCNIFISHIIYFFPQDLKIESCWRLKCFGLLTFFSACQRWSRLKCHFSVDVSTVKRSGLRQTRNMPLQVTAVSWQGCFAIEEAYLSLHHCKLYDSNEHRMRW